ncbi:UNVERIFIED_CONTAM: hypothetical protein Slati_2246400 [Sesamum latifolium]|uniref:Uncharacterized protein n=1 Tax=Sesamum latifolium TaxID=2727402 RepID=A0AAW2WU08_9LAMI
MGTYKNTCVGRKFEEPTPYQKKETDRSKEAKVANPEASPRGGPKMGTHEKTDCSTLYRHYGYTSPRHHT